jgi:hypothetical protein
MQDYLRLDIGTGSPNIVTARIEIPKDCIIEYEYGKEPYVFTVFHLKTIAGIFV